MPDTAPPTDAGGLAGRGPESLSGAEIDRVLAEFRAWLEGVTAHEPLSLQPDDEPAIDLAALVGAFTALRHDVNLQTKATRAQAEQAAEALDLLHDVVERNEDVPESTNADADALLTSLVESTDALTRASQGIERALALTEMPFDRGWRRWFATFDNIKIGATREILASAAEGLSLAAQRAERTLAKYGLEPVKAVGRPFDPELMEALEVVTEGRFPAGVVVEEVRLGYCRNGSTFRTALVKVAK